MAARQPPLRQLERDLELTSCAGLTFRLRGGARRFDPRPLRRRWNLRSTRLVGMCAVFSR
jgi:hypothetical protein